MTDDTAPKSRDRIAYLVLGMHRSGTSAVTQLLALAGADLPAHVMPGDEHNARGYFEPWKIAVFNDQRLRAGGGAWDDVFAFPFRALPGIDERRWLARAVNLMREEFAQAPHPLLKDPRITVLMPLWRAVLNDMGIGARCVIPVRSPLAVAGSLARRNGFAPEKSVLLWTTYMLAAEAGSRGLPRAFVGYDALLADWRGEVAAMEAAHGARLPALTDDRALAIDEFLTPELRHNAGEGDLAALGWTGALAAAVHGWFQAAAAGGASDTAVLDEAAAEIVRRNAEFGFLVSPVSRDHDACRALMIETQDQLREVADEKRSLEARLTTRVDALEHTLSEADRALDDLLVL